MDRKIKQGGRHSDRNRNQRMTYLMAGIFLILLLVGVIVLVGRYTPTREHMELSDYFQMQKENEAAVILNGQYCEVGENEDIFAISREGKIYLEISFLKSNIDDGYVYDHAENILRYATDQEVITANLGSASYSVDKSKKKIDTDVVVLDHNTAFVALDFIKLYSDVSETVVPDPQRVILETAGYKKQVATLRKNTPLRRFGGVKSKILKDGVKGETVSVIENYGKWSQVLTEDGVLGCCRNNKLNETSEVTVEAKLPERKYQHISLDEKICLGWHQVSASSSNDSVAEVLGKAREINVISPTWFYLNDNRGGIANLATSAYVDYCHQHDVQVWGLVSNLENKEVNTTEVLNTTSSRDNLVNNLIAAAIRYDLDGINVDIESLSAVAADGYIQFIKELSIKCEKNDLILSVDNYVPTSASSFYNRGTQANYADYVVIMGYDEHYAGGNEAGSVASIGFVENGVKDTLKEVPAEQIILGMPFYCRVWETNESGLASRAMGMDAAANYVADHKIQLSWSEEEGQNYGEYVEGDTTYMIWLEDGASLEEKLAVMEKQHLAGGAFWKLGFDNNAIWNTIAKYMN